jgi:hypothetical protein
MGGALAETDEGERTFVLWPAAEYAKLCAVNNWSEYEAREIDLDTLFEILLPKLKEDGTLVGIFPIPSGKGTTPELEEFEAHLRYELAKIE